MKAISFYLPKIKGLTSFLKSPIHKPLDVVSIEKKSKIVFPVYLRCGMFSIKVIDQELVQLISQDAQNKGILKLTGATAKAFFNMVVEDTLSEEGFTPIEEWQYQVLYNRISSENNLLHNQNLQGR